MGESTVKTIFVETKQINQMITHSPYATTNSEKKKVKYIMLDSIKEGFGDKWDRLKEGTRQAFDMACFLSAELGFYYAGNEYMANRYDISERTLRYRLKELVELGQAVKVYRRAKRCNGRGKPIYLFVSHPYFTYWAELLGLKIEDCHTDCHIENVETPCESKDEATKKVSTYSLPNLKTNNNHLNTNRSPYIQFVPKSLQHFQAYFGKRVKDIYSRVWLAAKKLKVAVDQSLMQRVGSIAMNQLKQYIKAGKQFTDEELYKTAYTIGLNQLQQHFERQDDSKVNEVENNQTVKTSIHKRYIRTEMVPEWLTQEKESVQTKKTIPVSEERKKEIWERVRALSQT
jgi:DNA-binding Lrp family transcriptional regulator